jgi:hypothetical protein
MVIQQLGSISGDVQWIAIASTEWLHGCDGGPVHIIARLMVWACVTADMSKTDQVANTPLSQLSIDLRMMFL